MPQRLSTRFPGNRLALLLDELVRRRSDCALAEADSRSATAESTPPSRIDPDAARQAFLEARLLIEKGRREDACAHLENALALDPENEESREALVSLAKQLGLELYGKGNSHKASVYWRRVLEIRPEDEEAKKFLLRANRVLENR